MLLSKLLDKTVVRKIELHRVILLLSIIVNSQMIALVKMGSASKVSWLRCIRPSTQDRKSTPIRAQEVLLQDLQA